ncbi:uncharacterized protein LOC107500100 isoform X3 [Rousettus aegyptiacus]|uniref:uncharacterized protein LOC107500100 isoform X3 n=1 Tax=Rousettus aegyptiacus TaxID=9407 RepID=UPI00168CE024|nr:uncharacterized protein LOC107500100 isoform X3 [Rousettus aegyptiacus]
MCVGRELLRDVPLTRAEVPSQLPFIRWASANHHCSCKVGRGVNYLMSGTGRRNQAWIALPLLLSFFRESATGREHISCMQILFKKSIGKTPFMKTPGRHMCVAAPGLASALEVSAHPPSTGKPALAKSLCGTGWICGPQGSRCTAVTLLPPDLGLLTLAQSVTAVTLGRVTLGPVRKHK